MDRRSFLTNSTTAAATLGCGLGVRTWGAAPSSIVPPAGKAEHVIFIWLGGGMAQIDTFDPKQRGSSAERSREPTTT